MKRWLGCGVVAAIALVVLLGVLGWGVKVYNDLVRKDVAVSRILSRVGFNVPSALAGTLSGGWNKRLAVAAALAAQPDILLLDEPTNHLDIEAIEWLENHLRDFAGTLLFVTHDRAFLQRLATRIIELDRGELTAWPGSYESYLEKKAAALDTEARDLERLDKKLAEEEAWLRRGIKARRTRDEGRVRALMTLRAERAAYRAQSGSARMALAAADSSGRMVFELDHVSKSYGGTPVVRDVSTRIMRGDRVGLIGSNGSGKTTLLQLLVGELAPDAGEVRHGTRLQLAYFDQQRARLDGDRTVAESVAGGDTVTINGEERHVLGYLADFLFPPERARSPVSSLSGGERNRLLLARLFTRPANVLVFDEPTNDLDIETLELLEDLIEAFDGTVLLVTHDRAFLDNVVTSTLAFEGDGVVRENVGGWEDYVRSRRAAPVDRADERRERERPERQRPERPDRKKRTFNEEREYAALPSRIEALEIEQQQLQEQAAAPEFYKSPAVQIQTVLARIDTIHAELEQALARWVELEEVGR